MKLETGHWKLAGRWLGFALGAVLAGTANGEKGYDYLAKVMDQYHTVFYVYDDFLSAGNHFAERAQMCNAGDQASVPPMDEASTVNPHSGRHSIQCSFRARGSNWGGWMFLNGSFPPGGKNPELNWGDVPDAGHDLRGATTLTFWARGEKGGEKVKFFCCGVGRDPLSGRAKKPHPDSAPQTSTGYLTLSKDWKRYSIDLQGLELRNVLLGFAWMTKSTVNRHQDITFYLDDIAFDKPRLDQPRLLLSYRTLNSDARFDSVLSNVAYTYDNAVALMAFVESGDLDRAKLVADALIYAQQHDRFFSDGRLRNAYQGGDLTLPPGWRPGGEAGATRLPGWWDPSRNAWLEDPAMTGTYAGNMAWAMLALVAYYENAGGEEYLEAAEKMGDWIATHCRDSRGAGGFTAGYEGWEPSPVKLLYKSTEHNIDLYAAFKRLYHLTGARRWLDRTRHAQQFVRAMWDPVEGKFWTGTGDDGILIVRHVVPVDVQAWSILALKEDGVPYWKGLAYAEQQFTVGRGYDFNDDADGIWHEGTAQMAVAFACCGQEAKSRELVEFLRLQQDSSGGLTATDRDRVSTGFHMKDGQPWLCYKRLHVAATAWLVLAEHSTNPFWLGSRFEGPVQVAMKAK